MQNIELAVKQTYEAYQKFLELGTIAVKNAFLERTAVKILEKSSFIIDENKKDIQNCSENNISKSVIDRILLNNERIEAIASSLKEIVALPDPVGRITDMTTRPEGFKVGKMRTPIGVIAMIYEARPHVTIDAAALLIKSGNAAILRGGKDAYHSNLAFVQILKEVLSELGLNENLITYIESTDYSAVDELLKQDKYIHLVIPRGGESLIRSVVEKSRIPVLKHYKGVCHIYVSSSADFEVARRIILNAKVQRPSTCNALETLLIDKSIAASFVPLIIPELQKKGVEINACQDTINIYNNGVKLANEDDWNTEYLDLKLSIKIVENFNNAVSHINKYSSGHTESIITTDYDESQRFITTVDSSSVMINASTRLADGGVYGMGAEIGISTDRLHARGPMGLDDLTTYKWIVFGNGSIRE